MKFIIDAQLPDKLKAWLIDKGYDTIHTNDLTEKHLTFDQYIMEIAEKENRIKPEQLLFITTGNIVNKDLIKLFELNFLTIKHYFDKGNKIVELDNSSIKVHL